MEAPIQILQFLINVLSLGGLYALMALGLALVYSILNFVNFAYGELVMISGYTLLVVGQATNIPWMIVAAIAIFMGYLWLGLAPQLVDEIFQLVAQLHKTGVTILLVEQNVERTLEIADRVYLLNTGEIEFGGAAGVLRERVDFVSAYLGESN